MHRHRTTIAYSAVIEVESPCSEIVLLGLAFRPGITPNNLPATHPTDSFVSVYLGLRAVHAGP